MKFTKDVYSRCLTIFYSLNGTIGDINLLTQIQPWAGLIFEEVSEGPISIDTQS